MNGIAKDRDEQVVIVGAGLAGLVTAYELHTRGVPVVVLERSPAPGGRIRTIAFDDGATAEAHLEELWASNPAVALARRLGLTLVEQPVQSSVVLDGELHLAGADGRCSLTGPAQGREVGDAVARWQRFMRATVAEQDTLRASGRWTDRLRSLVTLDLRALVAGMGLPSPVAMWIRLHAESESGIEWERVSALDAIDDLRSFVVDDHGRACEASYRVDGGNSRLVDALVAELPTDAVRTGVTVEHVRDDGAGVDVRYRDATGRRDAVRGTHAVLTLPLWELRAVDVHPALGPGAQAAITSTATGSYVKTVLHLDPAAAGLWDRYDGRLFPVLTDALPGCVYLSAGRVPGQGLVLTALAYGAEARRLHDLGEHAIATRVLAALQSLRARSASGGNVRLFPAISDWVDDVRVFDCPRAVAYWPHALHRSRFDALSDAVRAPHGRVLLGGDSTDGTHSDGAMRAARRMIDVIAAREHVG